MWQRVKRGVIMAYTVKIHTFNDGKVMFEDRIAYANGEYVSLNDFKISTQRKNDEISDLRKELRESKACITQLKHELEKTYNQLMEVEKESQERIAELESELEVKDNLLKIKNVRRYEFMERTYELCHKCRKDFERFMKNE